MSNTLIVYKNRTNIVPVSLGFDVSLDTLTSEIKTQSDSDSTLIATWSISYVTDGVDGEIILTLDDSVTSLIDYTRGYMDIKRVTGGEPVSVFEKPLYVDFCEVVTQ